jgi:hypothetical protein
MAIGANKVDWEDVAHTLECITPEERFSYDQNVRNYKAAIALCRRMAAGELVERSETRDLLSKSNLASIEAWAEECRQDQSELMSQTVLGTVPHLSPVQAPAPALSNGTQDVRKHCGCLMNETCRCCSWPTETPAPKTSDEDESDTLLCECIELSHIGGPMKRAQSIRDYVERSRQAARAEGYQECLLDSNAGRHLELLQSQLAEQEAYTSKIADRCAALSARLKRLTDAARANVDEWQSYIDNGECDPSAEAAYTVCVNDTLAVLAEVESKKVGGKC